METYNTYSSNDVDIRMELYNMKLRNSIILPLEKKLEGLKDFISQMRPKLDKLEVKINGIERRLKCLESEKSKTG